MNYRGVLNLSTPRYISLKGYAALAALLSAILGAAAAAALEEKAPANAYADQSSTEESPAGRGVSCCHTGAG